MTTIRRAYSGLKLIRTEQRVANVQDIGDFTADMIVNYSHHVDYVIGYKMVMKTKQKNYQKLQMN